MRVTNIIREKIDRTLSKELDKKIAELYADKWAFEQQVRDELAAVVAEANIKADAIIAKYPNLYLSRYGDKNIPYIRDTAMVNFPKDAELDRKTQELREKKRDVAMDMEIRCALEKDADKFFEMLAEASL